LAEERRSVRQAVLSCSLTEEQAQSGEEEEEDGTETD